MVLFWLYYESAVLGFAGVLYEFAVSALLISAGLSKFGEFYSDYAWLKFRFRTVCFDEAIYEFGSSTHSNGLFLP